MRSSIVLLLCSLAGMLLGGVLIAPWAVGVAIMIDSAAVGVYALFHDDGKGEADWQPQVFGVPSTSLDSVLERARRAG